MERTPRSHYLHFAIGFLASLVIGGLNGIVTAVIPVDWQVHDTYFVVSHLHYVLVGTNMLPVFAAFYYWLPKITGKLMNETIGKWSFWFIFIGLNAAFFPMHVLGLRGMTRRIYTYPPGLGWETMNMISSIGAFLIAAGVLISIWNFLRSLKAGPAAGPNPWGADTLEWSIPSPPPSYGSVHLPTVVSRHPLWDDHEEEYDPKGERILDQGRLTFATSALDANLSKIARMPEDSVAPLLLTVALTIFFFGVIFASFSWMAAGVLANVLVACYWLWPSSEQEPL